MNGIELTQLQIVLGIATLAVVVAIVLTGVVFAILAQTGTSFLRRNLPNDKVQNEFNTIESARLTAQRENARASGGQMNPNFESFAVAVVMFALASVGISIIAPAFEVRAMPMRDRAAAEHSEHAAPAGATASLPTTGNFTEIVAGLPPGHPDEGLKLYSSEGCVGCHSLKAGQTLVGPSLAGAYGHAATRVAGMGATEYLYQSIVSPNSFIVPNFQPNVMQQTYAKQLTPQKMADILAWMERDLK